MKLQVIYVLVVIGIVNCDSGSDWSYNYETQWPNQCRSGEQQSPINIMTRNTILDTHGAHIRGPLVFRGFGDVNLRATNTGRTLKWMVEEDGPAPVLSGGPLRGNYTFVQFHLHWFSEHAIDGMKYPMEIHLLHVKTGLTVAEALKRPDGLAVIGVLCRVFADDEDNDYSLHQLADMVPSLQNRTVAGSELPITLDLYRLMSPQRQSYYTYHGSLTTPDCQEVVTWIVQEEPIIISDSQYKKFRQVYVGGVDNYRSLQPTNRVVYRSAASSLYNPSPIGMLGALLSITSLLKSTVGSGVCFITNLKRKFFTDSSNACKGE
ncbi:PREDICTED: putative carbonic anhydrase 5 [Papilio polytes]|uniref:putative carbonic anhydrase 5 n=1 Tax=Papilio polytes TaxID=76194 RepID=UPI000675E71A|nr:PREDICTED: putative carbonic anhydrase 5 [Papilio polytes]